MMRQASLFSQLLSFFDRTEFQRLVLKHQVERHAKGFSSWKQFVGMLFCQVAQANSLREICWGLAITLGKLKHLGLEEAPKRSTLAYANCNRPWPFFQELFYHTLSKCQQVFTVPKKKFRFKNKLLSLDSTVISLSLSLFPWANFNRVKGGVKLHLLLDHEGYLPTFAVMSHARLTDPKVAYHIPLTKGSIVVVDRGYTESGLYGHWTKQGIYFVTRLRSDVKYRILRRRPLPKNSKILRDEIIALSSPPSQKKCPYPLRRIVVFNEEKGEEIALLTNHLEFGATTISEIYRDRWQIELFFKALKQNLKVKTFVGTSENAIYIQIWTALMAILLFKFFQFKAQFNWSLSNLVAFLRWSLFSYRDLWDWLDDPFNVFALPPPQGLKQLSLPGFGQLK